MDQQRLVALLNDPQRCADLFDEAGAILHALAVSLRAIPPTNNGGINSTGGLTDRIRAQIIGPDGKIKQTIDTGA